MADPFSIAAGAFGIIVPALHATRLLLDDLQKISEAPSTMEISPPQWAALGATVVEQSKNAITSCTKSCTEFRTDLQRWTRHSNEGDISWRDRASLDLFRQNQIKAMSDQLQKYRTTLNLVVSTAILHSSIRGQRLTGESKTTIAAKEKDIANAITSTNQQLSMLDKQSNQLNPTDIERGNTSGTEDTYKDEAEGLKRKTQDEAKRIAEEERKQTTEVTFGNNDSGFQLGANSGTISGCTFGGPRS
ncbi:hypothetical protein M406DRAFT_326835 [Cryphonectria parasitica EP155]|uniref:Azaphilone pigments biosynthesis cluster protein L N-terminal domain-containing protein n=1 Tax=Cryphonectria parasitica (strain ATCC 38755 / EP155) TaxID=660469 RepID=A0A9P4Y8Z9_CRYP1|nr:uncharacterized protein M406DRAFT_326835 [Cryphonectria parasitica EP155]KAF3768255.1 hypothetical protein M406DRAFT_326835 [Cryphonectria parasitica EP155]